MAIVATPGIGGRGPGAEGTGDSAQETCEHSSPGDATGQRSGQIIESLVVHASPRVPPTRSIGNPVGASGVNSL
jgi:hypothetical protein